MNTELAKKAELALNHNRVVRVVLKGGTVYEGLLVERLKTTALRGGKVAFTLEGSLLNGRRIEIPEADITEIVL